MGKIIAFCGALFLAIILCSARAQYFNPSLFFPHSMAPAGYTGPCDSSVLSTAPVVWWGLRGCGSGYVTGSKFSIDVNQSSSGVTCSFLITTSGDLAGTTSSCSNGTFNGQTQATFCPSSTACTTYTAYGYPTGANNWLKATSQPPYFIPSSGCGLGSFPCLHVVLVAATLNVIIADTPVPYTVFAVCKRNSGIKNQAMIQSVNDNMEEGFSVTSGDVYLYSGTLQTAAASEGNWHFFAFIHPATGSGQVDVDGTITTVGGSVGTLSTSTVISFGPQQGVNPMDFQCVEEGLVAGNPSLTALHANEKAYWGTP